MAPAELPPLRLWRPGAGARPHRPGRELLLTFGFRCNFACTFCYVEDGLAGRYHGLSLADARRVLADPQLTAGVTRVVLSGGEVTLEPELADYVAAARAVPSVEHVRIQTNASLLASDDLAARLVAMGVDELFVSLHAADAPRSDAITQRPGSLAAILAGLDAARAAGATVITNTVVCAANIDALTEIVALAHARGAVASELWGYVPRVDTTDQRRQLVRVTEAAPYVRAALEEAERLALPMTVRFFPRCLLGRFAERHSGASPRLIIDDVFWKAYPQYGCLYEGACAAAGEDGCTGLSDTYVRAFGWEEDSLVPFASEGAATGLPGERGAPVIAAYHAWAHAPTTPTSPPPIAPHELAHLRAVLGLDDHTDLAGARLVTIERRTGALRLWLAGGDHAEPLAIDVAPRDDARPCFARTRSLDLTHPAWPPELTMHARPLLAALVEHLTERDRGELAAALLAPVPASDGARRMRPRGAVAAPRLVPDGWPAPANPVAGAVLERAAELVVDGALSPTRVEPSVVLGRPEAWRLLLDAASPEATCALLDAAGAPAWMLAHAARWLGSEGRAAYVAIDASSSRARLKLYLATPDRGARHAAAHQLALSALASDVQMIGVDVEHAALIAHKRYRRIGAAEARARFVGGLLELVESRGLLLGELRLLAATRHGPTGDVLDEALHVEVHPFPQLALGSAWARACGDHVAAARIEAAGRPARVLSETLGTTTGRHVYLAGPA